ncbi:phenoloxidase 3-like [Sitodiplosis mosellana]|uniref:phenoloxidase 3-like n=1 Tax=Sitodiplosis mosellana TaxID=263140 RepID=UPI0024441142|nr:phenoloxidase 3-like [Sitodiplosis mosellana]
MPITNRVTLPLCRPREPAFVPKLNCRFDIPADHLPAKYKDIGVDILEQYNDDNTQKLPVKEIQYPNLKFLKTFSRRSDFTAFNPQHMKYATELMKIFESAKDLDELISLALYCRDQLNSDLFVYSYYTVLEHRHDTHNLELPYIFEINPHQFFDKHDLSQLQAATYESENIKRNTRAAADKNEPVVIEVAFRGRMSIANPEEKLKFFREDIAVNSMHYQWHTVYPFDGPSPEYYDKDRRGELFYFMHHQIMNWYDCNRLTAGIPLTVPFDYFRKPIERGIYPELTTATNKNLISPRQDNVYLQDLLRPEFNLKVADLERWYERIVEAVDKGFGIDPCGNKINLLNDKGIDFLGNTVEPNVKLSMNSDYYGSLHNFGHRIIAFAHDPTNKYKTPPSLMRDTATALRDHVFYEWHKMVDQLFMRLKNKLPSYKPQDLQLNGVNITSLNLLDESKISVDELITFWQKSTVDLRNGLDFQSNKPSLITFTHLNYQHFTYSLGVENRNDTIVEGTVRIFLLPIKDEAGEDFSYDGCRKLAILIDQFPSKFSPGMNQIKRKSSESTVTIPFDRTFPVQKDGTVLLSDQPEAVKTFCKCGWPQHLLFPKGTEDGYPFRLFAMISDYKLDKVDQGPSNGICSDSYVLCGLQNRKYPDKRPMGFPFDRPADDGVTIFDDFLTGMGNMISKSITIRHLDENMAQVDNVSNKIVKL